MSTTSEEAQNTKKAVTADKVHSALQEKDQLFGEGGAGANYYEEAYSG